MWNQDTEKNTLALHLVEPDAAIRAEFARVAHSVGYHCEPYSDFSELAAYAPHDGIIILRDAVEFGSIRIAMDRLLSLGIWLPVVAIDFEPSPGRVVEGVKNGALDYLALPIKPERLAASMARIGKEAAMFRAERLRTIEARQRLSLLSGRELQVLDALTDGGSNKEIARTLQISPRTVEIHRANMMTKLGVRHAVEAVRVKLDAAVGASVH